MRFEIVAFVIFQRQYDILVSSVEQSKSIAKPSLRQSRGLAQTRILFVWSGLTGYMGDCWRELAQFPGMELKVSVDTAGTLAGGNFNADEVMRGLDWSNRLSSQGWTPDVVFTVGWHNPLCREAAIRDWGAQTRKVCCFDMPWEWRFRKFAARFVLWHYLRRFDAAFVNGASAARYARWLGFSSKCIHTGLISTNLRRFGPRKGGGGFLYVGRESPEKGVDILRAAHACYRANGGKWPLRIVSGVSPDALGEIYAEADCFVLASLHESWGVVLVEAAAAGLPIICTDACGARHEVVKGNGIVVKAGNVGELAEAMMRVSRMGHAGLFEIVEGGNVENRCVDGELGRELAKPYSCEAWAGRVVGICKELTR